MKPEPVTIFELFDKQRRYLVPVFQRGYVWNRGLQWEPLWEDLRSEAHMISAGGSAIGPKTRKHFLGAIVLGQAPTGIRHVPTSEVIDGQQRLLTLQVLLAAFRDIVTELGNDYLRLNLERLTNNPGPLIDPNEIFKV